MSAEPVSLIDQLREGRIAAYRAAPGDIQEHFGIEETVLAGGYGYRQVMELVQNGADAILEEQEENGIGSHQERITVALADRCLYVANTGAPLSQDGVKALLQSHSSPKRGNQIGRFGIGFKSLLRLGGRIDLISRGMSVRFDPEKARSLIRNEFSLRESDPVPAIRVAWNLDGEAERVADPKLAEFDWATTVVRAEIRNEAMLTHVRDEMERFPGAFLLFLPVPVRLVMDFGQGMIRSLERRPDGEDSILVDGEDSSRWRVVEQTLTVTDREAIDDATHLHARSEVPLAWAMPLDARREEAGRFWAFFPTETPTRIPGIVNAPWKLNSDRKSLIDGEWNRLLMREAARLVSGALPSLSSTDDPGKPLDAFPRRVERKDELATTLVEELWKQLAAAIIVPDGDGALRGGSALLRHPVDEVELIKQWTELANADARQSMVHATAVGGDRKGRLDELSQRIDAHDEQEVDFPGLDRVSASRWLGMIATDKPDAAVRVLALTARYSNEIKQAQWQHERGELEIIPTRGGGLCKVGSAIIAPEGAEVPNRFPVHDELLDDAESLWILTDVLGIGWLDNEKWQELLLKALKATSTHYQPLVPAECVKFWDLLRAAPSEVGRGFAKSNNGSIPLRRADEKWRRREAVLLPGSVVSLDDEPNKGVLVDTKFHERDREFLDLIGVGEFPRGHLGPGSLNEVAGSDSSLLSDWVHEKRWEFRGSLPSGKNPQSGCLNPGPVVLPHGWMMAQVLSGGAQAKATERIIDAAIEQPSYLAPVEFGHDTREDVYPTIRVSSPLGWLLCNFGTISICSTPVAVAVVLRKLNDPILERVPNWPIIKAKLLQISDGIETEVDKEENEQFWRALLVGLVTFETMAETWLRGLWDGMAEDQLVPSFLPSLDGQVPIAEAHHTTSRDLARHARDAGLVVAEVSISTGKIWESKGAKGLDDLFELEWEHGSEQDSLLAEAVPEVADVLKEGIGEKAVCRCVSGLKTRFGESAGPVACVLWDGTLHADLDQLQEFSRSERLGRILAEVENAGWLICPADQALGQIADSHVDARRREVSEGVDLADRLLRAIGGRIDVLLDVIGDAAASALADDPDPRQVAELTLALLGPLVLQRISGCLSEEGLRPPGGRWGTSESRLFVASLGFPEEFAAAPGSKRDAELLVSGPIHLPPLHDFQEEVVEGLRELVESSDGRRRAVVSLPTGGGKTRATVQAAVELVLAPLASCRSVLWIAQTDELCEQAVQAFRQVWSNVGAQSTDLRVVRLWGGHRNPARFDENQPVAVIASIQTLTSRVGQEDLAWLSEPGLVVIDECHHAITKSYTGVLKWLDAEAPRGGATPEKEPPVIGLSATPFRSSPDPDESLRLAKRFDRRWLPGNQEHLYQKLLDRGILAHADHEALQSDVEVSAELLRSLENLDFDSIEAGNILEEINRRLAIDQTRNELLIDTIVSSGASSILCFANSVDHANEITARLCVRGISAAAVSGQTPRSARRYFLSRFQSGEIRVLCNYLVLSTGFDAPKTDMLLISRQVMSPVRYMQMVGRGLRGPANGGTERCRIVTVMDNLGKFSGRHPYHFCAHFFTENGKEPRWRGTIT